MSELSALYKLEKAEREHDIALHEATVMGLVKEDEIKADEPVNVDNVELPVSTTLTWNTFRTHYKGQGYTVQELSALYKRYKQRK